MSPNSSSGIASFCFCVAAIQNSSSQTQRPDSAHYGSPPSDLLLRAGTTQTTSVALVPGPACLSALPTALIYLIQNWLIDTESLQLILTSHALSNDVQSFYQLRLRAGPAKQTASKIALCQDSTKLLPACVPMGSEGELMFQKCLVLRTPELSESACCSVIIDNWQAHIAKTTDFDQLRDLTAGAALGLGGTGITEPNRDALLNGIFDIDDDTGRWEKMGALIRGVCIAVGRQTTQCRHIQAVLELILNASLGISNQRFRALTDMIHNLCLFLGAEQMTRADRAFVLTRIMDCHQTQTPAHIRAAVVGLCRALGGKKISPDNRDALMLQIPDLNYDGGRELFHGMLHGVCAGVGAADMTRSNLDAILARILRPSQFLNEYGMGAGIGILCRQLGGRDMSPAHRDIVVAKILASYETSESLEMGVMIGSVCHNLGYNPSAPVSTITQDNLEAILGAVLKSHQTSKPFQMGEMLVKIFSKLGHRDITPAHRAIMVARIMDSGRVREIMAAMRLTNFGDSIVDFLQLEKAGDWKQVNTTI